MGPSLGEWRRSTVGASNGCRCCGAGVAMACCSPRMTGNMPEVRGHMGPLKMLHSTNFNDAMTKTLFRYLCVRVCVSMRILDQNCKLIQVTGNSGIASGYWKRCRSGGFLQRLDIDTRPDVRLASVRKPGHINSASMQSFQTLSGHWMCGIRMTMYDMFLVVACLSSLSMLQRTST